MLSLSELKVMSRKKPMLVVSAEVPEDVVASIEGAGIDPSLVVECALAEVSALIRRENTEKKIVGELFQCLPKKELVQHEVRGDVLVVDSRRADHRVLQVLSARGAAGMTLSQVCDVTQIPVSSCYALLMTLVSNGQVLRDMVVSPYRYRLNPEFSVRS